MRALQPSENQPVNLLTRAQHRRCPWLRSGLDNPPIAALCRPGVIETESNTSELSSYLTVPISGASTFLSREPRH